MLKSNGSNGGTKIGLNSKHKFFFQSNEIKSLYFFVVFDIITAKIGRNTSMVLLNVAINKYQIFLQKRANTGKISI